MIGKIKNTNCYIVTLNEKVKEMMDIDHFVYDLFQVFDDMTDDFQIKDSDDNEIDVDFSKEIVLTNNKRDSNLFDFNQIQKIKEIEKITEVKYLINVNIKYWI